jgi:hypothetical protein
LHSWATDTTGRGFEQFLSDHARLLAWLPVWSMLALARSPAPLAACEASFARYVERPAQAASTSTEDLHWLFTTRQLVDQGDLARLTVAAIDRYRSLLFAGSSFDALYADWRQRGAAVLVEYAASSGRPSRTVGRLVTEQLKFDYSQFGSLPGVA